MVRQACIERRWDKHAGAFGAPDRRHEKTRMPCDMRVACGGGRLGYAIASTINLHNATGYAIAIFDITLV